MKLKDVSDVLLTFVVLGIIVGYDVFGMGEASEKRVVRQEVVWRFLGLPVWTKTDYLRRKSR